MQDLAALHFSGRYALDIDIMGKDRKNVQASGCLYTITLLGCTSLTPVSYNLLQAFCIAYAIKITQINLSDDSELLTMAPCTSNLHLQMLDRPSTLALKVWCWYLKAAGTYMSLFATICMQI